MKFKANNDIFEQRFKKFCLFKNKLFKFSTQINLENFHPNI